MTDWFLGSTRKRAKLQNSHNGNGAKLKTSHNKGIGSGCDEEALRVISSMPDWNPGRQNGKEVRVQLNMPISFKLM